MNAPPSPRRIVLLSTAPPGERGSMNRYVSLMRTLMHMAAPSTLTFHPLCLALPAATLSRIPAPIRNWYHHTVVACRAVAVLRRVPADLYHVMDGSHAYILPCKGPSRTIATAHDAIPLLQLRGELTPAPTRTGAWLIRKSAAALGRASHVMSVSTHTRNDLVRLGLVDPSRISVVHHAVCFAQMTVAARSRAMVLHVGNDGFYKNRATVLRVFARVRGQIPAARLTLAGAPPGPALQRLIHSLELQNSLDLATSISDQELTRLYDQAALLLFPSLYEGFGWPPLEAMSRGCPVVCSDAASLPEIVGDAALPASPTDEDTLTHHCLAVLRDSALALELSRKGMARAALFSHERMAKGLIAAYEQALA